MMAALVAGELINCSLIEVWKTTFGFDPNERRLSEREEPARPPGRLKGILSGIISGIIWRLLDHAAERA
jgi:hypothetical protein